MTQLYLPSLQKGRRSEFSQHSPGVRHFFQCDGLVANVPFDTKSQFFNNSVLISLFSMVPGLEVFIGGENSGIFVRDLLYRPGSPRTV